MQLERPAPFSMTVEVSDRKETSATVVKKVQTVWPDIDYCICVTEKGTIIVTGKHDFKHKWCASIEEAERELKRITKGLQIKEIIQ
jgi:hypothetical protein